MAGPSQAPVTSLPFKRLDVDLGERSYPILVGEDLLGSFCEPLQALIQDRQVALVSNQTVLGLHGTRLRAQLGRGARQVIDVVLPDGEQYKQWSTLNLVFDALLANQFDRKCLIIALGGGVIGDMAGLAAALYQRGVDVVQVPTTLLSQVDSSVGGKTAINHPAGKNMIGIFHQPKLVLADMSALSTLPAREISAGLAEMLKHGAIADDAYLDQLMANVSDLRRCDPSLMAAAVLRSCEIKAAVVAADEREAGLRAILNFGHTFGHAIEAGMGYGKWLHGEAVGAGMVMGADLSKRLGRIDQATFDRLEQGVEAAGLPTRGPAWPAERYLELMAVDKKASQGVPRFVVLNGRAAAAMIDVEEALVRQTLGQLATAAYG